VQLINYSVKRHLGEVFSEHFVDEAVTTTNTLKEKALGAVIKEALFLL